MRRPLLLTIAMMALVAVAARAQDAAGSPDSLFQALAAAQRSQVTREELQRSLQDIETVLQSGGYSAALRDQKRAEAEAIRRRLDEGDLYPGDVVALGVAGHPDLSGSFTVTGNRSIVVPGAGEIPVAHLLRSEVEGYLRTQMARFVRDPVVRADAQIRISLFGGVQRQGFFVVPASLPITDVIMQAGGGPSGNQDLEKSKILRGDRVIVDKDQFQQALRQAESLDQLNVRAGDEIRVGTKGRGILGAVGVVSGLASVTWLLIRIF